jgi:hypothetical protein
VLLEGLAGLWDHASLPKAKQQIYTRREQMSSQCCGQLLTQKLEITLEACCRQQLTQKLEITLEASKLEPITQQLTQN